MPPLCLISSLPSSPLPSVALLSAPLLSFSPPHHSPPVSPLLPSPLLSSPQFRLIVTIGSRALFLRGDELMCFWETDLLCLRRASTLHLLLSFDPNPQEGVSAAEAPGPPKMQTPPLAETCLQWTLGHPSA